MCSCLFLKLKKLPTFCFDLIDPVNILFIMSMFNCNIVLVFEKSLKLLVNKKY